jgi:hypothetical protein
MASAAQPETDACATLEYLWSQIDPGWKPPKARARSYCAYVVV